MELTNILMICQIVVLGTTIASMFVVVGRKDQVLRTVDRDLQELSNISKDLVKSVVSIGATQKHVDEKLAELARRIQRLEDR